MGLADDDDAFIAVGTLAVLGVIGLILIGRSYNEEQRNNQRRAIAAKARREAEAQAAEAQQQAVELQARRDLLIQSMIGKLWDHESWRDDESPDFYFGNGRIWDWRSKRDGEDPDYFYKDGWIWTNHGWHNQGRGIAWYRDGKVYVRSPVSAGITSDFYLAGRYGDGEIWFEEYYQQPDCVPDGYYTGNGDYEDDGAAAGSFIFEHACELRETERKRLEEEEEQRRIEEEEEDRRRRDDDDD